MSKGFRQGFDVASTIGRRIMEPLSGITEKK